MEIVISSRVTSIGFFSLTVNHEMGTTQVNAIDSENINEN
jgi:hypothetical protein